MDAQTAVNTRSFADIHKDELEIAYVIVLIVYLFVLRSNITYSFVFSLMPLVCSRNLHNLIRIKI
jgi:hypothetical protein